MTSWTRVSNDTSAETIAVYVFYHRSMYGASKKPWKVCRTVVCGQSEVDVSRILYILTYFIRCKDLVKSTALADKESGDLDLDSPRPRPRLGAFSQSDFSHRLSLSPQAEGSTQFPFHHEAPSTPASTSFFSGCRGSHSSPLPPEEACESVDGHSGFSRSASVSALRTVAFSGQKCKHGAGEIEVSSDSGLDYPYTDDDQASVSQSEVGIW